MAFVPRTWSKVHDLAKLEAHNRWAHGYLKALRITYQEL